MKELIKSLLGLGLTVGLSDREAFVKQVSTIIEEYQKDPEKAEKWSQMIVAYLENTKDNINIQNAVKSVFSGTSLPDSEQVNELTKAIKELTTELQKRK